MPAVRAEPYDFVFQPEHVAQGGTKRHSAGSATRQIFCLR